MTVPLHIPMYPEGVISNTFGASEMQTLFHLIADVMYITVLYYILLKDQH